MFCHFDSQKATQAAAVIMRHLGKRVTHLRLLKLLYIADRTAIKDRGHPIIGGRIVAMKNGPLHSPVYDLVKGSHPGEPFWSRFITTEGRHGLILSDEPEIDLLSEYEIDILNKTTAIHDQFDDFELADLTHEFPEWIKHHSAGTSTPIPMESIIDAVCDPEEKDAILLELKDKAVIDGIISQSAS